MRFSFFNVHFFNSCFLALNVAAAQGNADTPAVLRDVGIDQRLDEQVPLDLEFADETGKTVKLGDYFGNKPVILVLAYYRCPMLCTLVLNGLAQAMRDMPLAPGTDYQVVTVSFDPRETPQLAAEKKANYIAKLGRPGGAEAWHFLTGRPSRSAAWPPPWAFATSTTRPRTNTFTPAALSSSRPRARSRGISSASSSWPTICDWGWSRPPAARSARPPRKCLLYCFHYDPALGKLHGQRDEHSSAPAACS